MKYFVTGVLALVLAGPAAASSLRITIQNDAAATGFAITPLYGAVHNSNFDAFDVGSAATAGVREIAELGSPATLAGERAAADPNAQGFFAPVVTPAGGRPIFGGESVVTEITVNNPNDQRYFTFLSMVVPSNDLFIGSDVAIELFDASGNFNGPQTITLTGADVYDAGTEINDPTANPAFVSGVAGVNPLIDPLDPSLGSAADENGVITGNAFAELAQYNGLLTVPGFNTDVQQNLFGNAADFRVATITIEHFTAPVPLPAGGLLLLSAFGVGAAVKRRAKRA